MHTSLGIFGIYYKYGWRYALSLMASVIIRKIGLYDRAQLFKEQVRMESDAIFHQTIKYGPFNGVKMAPDIWWGKYDFLSKYLGEYESHILNELIALSEKYSHFIDIGAADGYYAIGLTKKKFYSTATCFEISQKGRQVLAQNAKMNNVQDKIENLGKANKEELSITLNKYGPSVILCDIEGEEFFLFDQEVLLSMKKCSIIIELHDSFKKNLKADRENFIKRAEKLFNISYITRNSPNVNGFDELQSWSDDLRMSAFSEGRPVRMEWILLTPKNI